MPICCPDSRRMMAEEARSFHARGIGADEIAALLGTTTLEVDRLLRRPGCRPLEFVPLPSEILQRIEELPPRPEPEFPPLGVSIRIVPDPRGGRREESGGAV